MKRRCKKDSRLPVILPVLLLLVSGGLCMPASILAGEIQGIVHLETQGVLVDGSGLPTGGRVSVMLFPLSADGVQKGVYEGAREKGPKSLSNTTPKRHDMVIKDKRLNPLFTTIRIGDSVRFISQDGMIHHLHAASAKHPFEVRLGNDNGENATATKEFTEEGSWYLYCKLHHSMFGQIDVVNSSYVQNLESGNKFSFSGLVPGKWQVRASTLDNVTAVTEAEAFTAPPMLELTLKIGADREVGTGTNPGTDETREAGHAREGAGVHE